MDNYKHYSFLEERDKNWVTIPRDLEKTLPFVTKSDIKAFPKEHRSALYRLWNIKFSGEVPFEEFYNAVRWRHDGSLYKDGNFAALAFTEIPEKDGRRKIMPMPEKMHRQILVYRQEKKDWLSLFLNFFTAGAITIGGMSGINYIGSKYPLPANEEEPTEPELTKQRIRRTAAMLASMQEGKITVFDGKGYITREYRPADKIRNDLEWLAAGARDIQALNALLEKREKTALSKKENYALAALTLRVQHSAKALEGFGKRSELDLIFEPIAQPPYEPDMLSTGILAELYNQARPEEIAVIRKSLAAPCKALEQICNAYSPAREKILAGKATADEYELIITSIARSTEEIRNADYRQALASLDTIISRACKPKPAPIATQVIAPGKTTFNAASQGANSTPSTAAGGND